ncbi:MAG TPA: TonB-dependent receptor [Vicinamibacterales bacterium]|nr:TonB-dependent receptor [Vicinamibacterales bacterium]
MKRYPIGLIVVALIALVLVPASAWAQGGAISGVVKDASGGVLPGVTVEAASPELIEKVKTVVTDDRGLYTIVDLRPGVYTVTFSLTGFSTFKREGLELPASFTATVNADLKVGSLEETITVSGSSPIVDTSSAKKAVALERELLDAIPSGRTAQAFGQLVPGITNAAPDVGGAHAISQVGMSIRGNAGKETTVMLDGIQLNGACGNGSTQAYTNTQSYEEMVFLTSGAGAEVASPGVLQNMIPRQGGNQMHGSLNWVYANRNWQAADLTQDLIDKGLRQGNKLYALGNLEGGVGGKFIRDRFWWFSAARRQYAYNQIPDTQYPDGSPGVSEDTVKNLSLRLTSQLTSQHKLTAYVDRVSKEIGHDMQAGFDPVTASRVWEPSKLYQQAQAKMTSTFSRSFMTEIGYAQYQAYRHTTYQDGIEPPYGTPQWFARAVHVDSATGRTWHAAPGGNYYLMPTRKFFSAIASYVTGDHNVRAGVQNNWGFLEQGTVLNAALRQTYQNLIPQSVQVYNTPERDRFTQNYAWGVFAQDTWRYKRASFSYGLRWDAFQSSIAAEESGQGVFVPQRTFGPEKMPPWKNLEPRFSATYDLLGNGKTAVKFSANKYVLSATNGIAAGLNPMRLQSASLSWTDLNGDDIAQGARGCVYLTPGCEMNFAQLPTTFGLITPGCTTIYSPGSIPCGTDQADPNIKRDTENAYAIGIQHELVPGVAVNAGYYYTRFYNLRQTNNLLQTFNDYAPVQIASPLDGSVITVYNVSAAKQSAVLNLQTSSDTARMANNSFEVGFSSRLKGGASMFGGVTTERTLVTQCDVSDNPNRLIYCDQTKNGIPFNTQFKIAGSVPLPWKLEAGASFQTYRYLFGTGVPSLTFAGSTVWQITRTTRYPADCKGPCTPGGLVNPNQTAATLNVPLQPQGTTPSGRIQQLDVNVGRWIKFRSVSVKPELSLFNGLNNRATLNVRSQLFLTSAYLQPSEVLQPRILRIGLQVKW